MATSWIVEAITSAVSETGTKTANLADGNNFNVHDSSGDTQIFRILNDSSDYYSLTLYGHDGQPAKFYMAADNGTTLADAWLWQVADGGCMSWSIRSAGTGDPQGDAYAVTTMALDGSPTKLTLTGLDGGTATLALIADEGDDGADNWQIQSSVTSNKLYFLNNISGSAVTHLTITPNATDTSSNVTVAGSLTTGDDLAVTGDTVLTGDLAVNGDDITCDGDLTFDVTGDTVIDSDGGDFYLKDAGTQMMRISTETTSVAIGQTAGDAFGTADLKSVAIGKNALTTEDSAVGNVAIGHDAMKTCNYGSANYNVAIGYEAMEVAASPGLANVLIGYEAVGHGEFTASNTVVIGREAAEDATGPTGLVAIGGYAAQKITEGLYNTAIGYEALQTNVDGDKNTAVGYQALKTMEPDAGNSHNTAVGYLAGTLITTGEGNTLMGSSTGDSLTTGDDNVAIGVGAFATANTNESRCVAIGRSALEAMDSDSGGGGSDGNIYNVGIGYNAGTSVTTGYDNTIIGGLAGDAITTGFRNVAIGTNAFTGAQDVDKCVVVGSYAADVLNDENGDGSMFIGYSAGGAINPHTDLAAGGLGATFIGYQAGLNLGDTSAESGSANVFNKENTLIGYKAMGGGESDDTPGNTAWSNTALGFQALMGPSSGTSAANITGYYNTALGDRTIMANTTGHHNVGINHGALTANTSGNYNIAIGSISLNANATGSNNISIGTNALALSTGGGNNVAIGHEALYTTNSTDSNGSTAIGHTALKALTVGQYNVAVGYQALLVAADSDRNTAIGYNALAAMTGISGYTGNTAVGHNAGVVLTTGVSNTFMGTYAGDGTDDGSYNTAVGEQALSANCGNSNTAVGRNALLVTTGVSNTMVGTAAGDGVTTGDNNSGFGAGVAFDVDADNQTAIGYGATTDSANDIAIGNTSVDEVKGQVDFTTFSDERIKTNIIDNDLGLDFINMLKPRKFNKVCPAEYPDSIRKPNDEGAVFTDAQKNKVWDGLIAQEVKSAIDSCDTTFSGWNEESNSKQMITYSTLIMPLIKAIQELSVQVEELKSKLGE